MRDIDSTKNRVMDETQPYQTPQEHDLTLSELKKVVRDAIGSLRSKGIERWEILEEWEIWEHEQGNLEVAKALRKALYLMVEVE